LITLDNLAGSRLVNLIPRPDFDGYGFDLLYDNQNNGPAIVENVKPNSPAFNCGLRESDLLLKINNMNVANEQYTKIISMIRELKESKGIMKLEVFIFVHTGLCFFEMTLFKLTLYLTLKVIDKSLYRPITRSNVNPAATEQEFSINQLKNHKKEIRFKRCNLKRLPHVDAFGFIVTPQAKPKYSIYQVDLDSPAYKANLRKSDVIIEVNKQNIRRMKFIDVLKLLKNDSTHETMEILAISREGYDHYKDRNKRFSSKKLANYENTDLYTT
jgi:C-terminal processing protease CtpA/Prc